MLISDSEVSNTDQVLCIDVHMRDGRTVTFSRFNEVFIQSDITEDNIYSRQAGWYKTKDEDVHIRIKAPFIREMSLREKVREITKD